MSDDPFARALELIEHAGRLPDATARGLAQDLVGAVLEIHRVAIARAIELAPDDAWTRLADDPAIANVLLLHGLHPTPIEERVRHALEEIGAVLLAIEDGVARIGARGGERMRASIEKALVRAAPDLAGWTVEELELGIIPAERLLGGP